MSEKSPAGCPQPGTPDSRRPLRADGPTPAGGADSIAYHGSDDEIVEIVEFDAMDRAIRRTYFGDSRASEAIRPEVEYPAQDDRGAGAPPREFDEPPPERVEQPDFTDEDLAAADEAWRLFSERRRSAP